MHVRQIPDSTGVPLIALVNANPNAQGLSVIVTNSTIADHIANHRLDEVPPGYQSTDNVPVSSITIRINEQAMAALPFPAEIGDDLTLHYDIHITPLGGLKQVFVRGKFIVHAGVTQ
jgi:hypothetical protein